MKNEPSVEAVCGFCAHWAKMEPGANGAPVTIGDRPRGMCLGCPPTPFPVMDQRGQIVGQRNLRPITVDGERACALYVPADAFNDGDFASN